NMENGDGSNKERELLCVLAEGSSISRVDGQGLIEMCDGCGKVFMASRLRQHIRDGKCTREE
ncbi:hypothetical protein D1B31_23830, partial [Neobacillus notoginsengisoli]